MWQGFLFSIYWIKYGKIVFLFDVLPSSCDLSNQINNKNEAMKV
jgi:hypothetical protein